MVLKNLALSREFFCFFFSLPKEHWQKLLDGFAMVKRGNFCEYFNHLLIADSNFFGLMEFTEKMHNDFENYNILQDRNANEITEELLQWTRTKIEEEKILERLQIYSALYAIPSFATDKISEEIDAEKEIVELLLEENHFQIETFLKHCKV